MRKILFFFFNFLLFSQLTAHEGKSKSYAFIENKGQWNEQIKFRAELQGTAVFFQNNAFHYQFRTIPDFHMGNIPEDTLIRGHVINANFVNSNKNVQILKEGESPFYTNYLLGNDASKWKGHVRTFEEITYNNLYNGIDLKVYRTGDFLKYDYIISPGSNTNQIQVQYEGAEKPIIREGKLVLSHSLGELIEAKPYAYQIINNEKIKIPCFYIINGQGIVQFSFPNGYNKSEPLIVDPELIFSTYSGSFSDNWGMTATYDNEGNGYAGGLAFGVSYIQTPGAYQTTFGGGNVDIAIAKYFAEGDSLIYATYLGGADVETVHSMVVDDNENLYILGASSSGDYPTTANAYNSNKNNSGTISTSTEIAQFTGGVDIIVSKLDGTGSLLLGSTFLGGSAIDGINFPSGSSNQTYIDLRYNYGDSHRGEIVLDSSGNCYIGTSTKSSDIPALNTFSGNQDGLIAKFNTDLSSLLWTRYHGGSDADAIYSLKVIKGNNILVGGGTTSFSDFPVTGGSYQSTSTQGRTDGFISIISADGTMVNKSTYIGTSGYDQVYFIEFDRFNGVYGFGQTDGGSFPIKNAKIAMPGKGQFFVKLDENLDSLVFSTTFGDSTSTGEINISPTAFLVDRCQNVYASGWGDEIVGTEGRKNLPNNMPRSNVTDPRFNFTDGNDFYLYVINRDVDSVLYASYFGGNRSRDHVDGGTSRFDKEGIIYQSVCASCGANNSDFPTEKAFSSTNNSGNCNNALFKFDFEILPRAKFTINKLEGCTPFIVNLIDSSKNAAQLSYDFYGTVAPDFGNDTTFTINTPGTYYIEQIASDTICDSESRFGVFVTVRPNDINLTTSNDTTICTEDSIQLFAKSDKPNLNYLWSKSPTFNTIINLNNDSVIKIKPILSREVYYIKAEESLINPCAETDSVVISALQFDATPVISSDTICERNSVIFSGNFQNIDQFVWTFNDGSTDVSNQNFTRLYTTAGDYNIRLIASNSNCPFSDTNFLKIRVEPNNLLLNVLTDTISCNQSPVRLTSSSNGTADSFLWSNSNLFDNRLNNNPLDSQIIVTPLSPTPFYLRISDKFCTLTDSVFVDAVQYNLDLVSLIDSACTPYLQQLSTTIIGLDSFRINLGNNTTTSTDPTPVISFSDPGTYTIQLAGYNQQCNFSDTLSETITLIKSVELDLFNDTLICAGDEITLLANTFGTAQQFIWDNTSGFSSPLNNPVDSTIQVNPNNSTRYYFKGTNEICDTVSSILVETEIVETEVDDSFSICIEDSVLIIALSGSNTTQLNYTWSPSDSILAGLNTTRVLLAPKKSFQLFLETTSSRNCKDFDTIEVEVNLPAFNDALISAEDDTLFKGQSVRLSTNREQGNLLYEWEPADGLNDPNSSRPIATPDSSKTYKVTITDLNTGCKVIAFKRLSIFEINCSEPEIFIPTAFTPNNDFTNDILFVRGKNINSIDLQLFNRWGEVVFETKELNRGWDGTYKGKEVDPGVFVYQLRVVCLDGQEYYSKGNITLIR